MHPFHDELVTRMRVIGGHADVLGLLTDAALLHRAANALADPFRDAHVDKVAGIEARGFALGTAVALELGAGFVAVRKPGAVHPGPKARVRSAPDWRGRELELVVQRAAIAAGDRVLVVDDWSETSSQALAAQALVGECGGEYVGLSLLVDQLTDENRELLAPVAAVADAAEFRGDR